MTLRLLFMSLLLVSSSSALAAMDRVHSSSGESSAPCPEAALAEPGDADTVERDGAMPASTAPAVNPPSSNNSPGMSRPSLRWHSYLPGMMK